MVNSPLADRLRPSSLAEFVGQAHLVGANKPIRLMVKGRQIHSMIFWGPPGCGKTTLGRLIAQTVKARFFNLSAVSAGKADIKKIVEESQLQLHPRGEICGHLGGENQTILLLDEIHRFNKAQQDYLLPFVETGTLILIGATTENPSFSVISPLLSRCQVFVLDPLTSAELKTIIKRGLSHLSHLRGGGIAPPTRRGKGHLGGESGVKLTNESLDFLIEFSNGDARQALNLLEAAYRLYHRLDIDSLKNALQSKFLRFDRAGEEHYNTISALIKSLRASNTDAALYYLARLVNAGEDPLFIARRLVVFASEDIGMAQPTALVVANDTFRACETIGYPECQENLAHCVVYLAKAPKDRSSYDAYFRALDDVKKYGNLPIPLNLRNPVTKLMKNLGYGTGYEKYTKESLLPDKIKNKKYYQNGSQN